jgi:hypothetical protein
MSSLDITMGDDSDFVNLGLHNQFEALPTIYLSPPRTLSLSSVKMYHSGSTKHFGWGDTTSINRIKPLASSGPIDPSASSVSSGCTDIEVQRDTDNLGVIEPWLQKLPNSQEDYNLMDTAVLKTTEYVSVKLPSCSGDRVSLSDLSSLLGMLVFLFLYCVSAVLHLTGDLIHSLAFMMMS